MGLYLPAGAMVFIAVPVAWDFVTSGLETGLGYGWLGISFWLLVRCGVQSELPRWQWYGSALVLGLGPLVRPDFAIFSGGFLLALAYLRFESHGRILMLRDFLWLVAAAGVLPVGYQIFRMGYYAALVPNTALAKEAGSTNWEQGRIYFNDFVDPYRLWIPLAIILGLCFLWLYRGVRGRDWPAVVLIAAPIITAALHAGYIVRVGGDFMHGRMLLPALFAIMLPVAAVRLLLSRRILSIATSVAIAGLLIWTVIAATSLRTDLGPEIEEDTGLVDERAFYVERSEHSNPITLGDYASGNLRWLDYGLDARERVANGSHAVLIRGTEYPISNGLPEEIRLVMPGGNIGILGYAAGTSVHVVDRLGLADPIGARLELEERRRPGHEKTLPMVWIVARFTTLGTDDVNSPDYPHALAVLECGEVAALIEATTAPLTPGRFVENVRSSWTFHSLRIPPEADEARERFCQ
jgi:arabinofuranosyltransferase